MREMDSNIMSGGRERGRDARLRSDSGPDWIRLLMAGGEGIVQGAVQIAYRLESLHYWLDSPSLQSGLFSRISRSN
ncbi:MAG: hypothetical protein Ct9H90mP23_1410 [Methanobacteriota archaeon]|nr:MAG: hypothetical protein Ct9H90mP23_1410 [Euryarchaeota archaeon]